VFISGLRGGSSVNVSEFRAAEEKRLVIQSVSGDTGWTHSPLVFETACCSCGGRISTCGGGKCVSSCNHLQVATEKFAVLIAVMLMQRRPAALNE